MRICTEIQRLVVSMVQVIFIRWHYYHEELLSMQYTILCPRSRSSPKAFPLPCHIISPFLPSTRISSLHFHHSYGLSTTCTSPSSLFFLLSSSSSRFKLPLLLPLLTRVMSCRLLFVLTLAPSLSLHCRRCTRIGGGRPSSHVAPVFWRCRGPAWEVC